MLSARINGFSAERFEVGHVPGVKFDVTSARPEAAREFRAILRAACSVSHTFRAGVVAVGSMGELLPAALVLCGARGVSAVGELSLGGQVRPVRGAFVMGEALAGLEVLCARENAAEFAAAGARPVPVDSLGDALAVLRGEIDPVEWTPPETGPAVVNGYTVDPTHIRGQWAALEAVATAIGRGRPVVLHGPPGCGKTLIGRCVNGILPEMADGVRVEATRIHSVAGLGSGRSGLIDCRPFRAPHHTASLSAMVGGGVGREARPGEFSLSHGGVLFLDELPEFARHVLEALPHILKAGKVSIARAGSVVEIPARPAAVVATANPCPCGYHGYPETGRACRCPALAVERYRARWQVLAASLGAVVVQVPPVPAAALLRADSMVSAEQVERLRALCAGVQS